MSKIASNGFTIIELLVVIFIIAILVGLLLPAVQNAREAARYTQCRNHLKQISLGVHLHENQYKKFPDGGLNWKSARAMNDGVPEVCPRQTWGWMYQILPFIEQGAIYSQTSDDLVRERTIPIYFCPSRRSSARNVHRGTPRGLNDYVGNGGIRTRPRAYWGNGNQGGFMVRSIHSPVMTPASILDGLANTLMVGEKSVHYQYYDVASCADNEGWSTGWDWDTIRWGNRSPKSDRNAVPCESWFGSVHQGGCLFAFGDGSIHTISYSIDQELFRSLSHRADQAPLGFEN